MTYDGNRWLNPLNKIKFQQAIKKKLELVVISWNESYSIDYEKRPGYVWIKRVGVSAPAGYFELSRVLDPHWLEQ